MMLDDADMFTTISAFVLARATGTPFTWRTPNTWHRLMRRAQRRGLVKPTRQTNDQTFWALTDNGERIVDILRRTP